MSEHHCERIEGSITFRVRGWHTTGDGIDRYEYDPESPFPFEVVNFIPKSDAKPQHVVVITRDEDPR